MTTFERLILLSEWFTLKVFHRENMTLSALAQEQARNQGRKSCIYSEVIDTFLWFDKNHCRKAYAYYRSCQRKQKTEIL